MSTVKSKKLQVGTDASASNNFTIYQPATPDGTLRIGVGNADSPTEVGRFDSNGYVATNAPAFSAYANATTSLGHNVWTKIQFQVEEFDTNSNYDVSTYRFTPTIAGYYQINGCLNIYIGPSGLMLISIFKNGSEYKRGNQIYTSAGTNLQTTVNSLVYCNGTTDYIELHAYQNTGSSVNLSQGIVETWFNGHLARAV